MTTYLSSCSCIVYFYGWIDEHGMHGCLVICIQQCFLIRLIQWMYIYSQTYSKSTYVSMKMVFLRLDGTAFQDSSSYPNVSKLNPWRFDTSDILEIYLRVAGVNHLYTLSETNELHLKIDSWNCWKMSVPFCGPALFSGTTVCYFQRISRFPGVGLKRQALQVWNSLDPMGGTER